MPCDEAREAGDQVRLLVGHAVRVVDHEEQIHARCTARRSRRRRAGPQPPPCRRCRSSSTGVVGPEIPRARCRTAGSERPQPNSEQRAGGHGPRASACLPVVQPPFQRRRAGAVAPQRPRKVRRVRARDDARRVRPRAGRRRRQASGVAAAARRCRRRGEQPALGTSLRTCASSERSAMGHRNCRRVGVGAREQLRARAADRRRVHRSPWSRA